MEENEINYEKNKKEYRKGLLSGIFSTLIVLIVIIFILNIKNISLSGGIINWTSNLIKANNELVCKSNVITSYIDKYSMYEKDENKIEDYMYKGLVASLDDPYSTYYTKEEYKELIAENSGKYQGIGIKIEYNRNSKEAIVASVNEDSPAMKAGMKEGDRFVAVNNINVEGKNASDISKILRSSENGNAVIEVERNNKNQILNIKLEELEIKTLESKLMNDEIGYIKIYEFNELTFPKFKEAVENLKKEGAKGIVFDVRDNPGGLLDSVVSVLDYVLPEGLLVYTEDKNGNKEEYKSDKNCLDLPYTVLINENSASAAELFSGAIKDYNKSKIVGVKSFGKGIVQSTFQLYDNSALKLTVEKYFTPNGTNIHGKGITPDVNIVKSDDKNKDNQLDAGIEELKKLMNNN